MIELTTGVVFLMSSLYGSGNADNHVTNISAQIPDTTITMSAAADSSIAANTFINDTKGMEAYLRQEFADTPILVDIARCESNFKQFDKDGNLIRGMANKSDVGVMQINEKYHSETAKKMNLDLHTIEGNVAYAKYLYESYGSSPWVYSSKCWSKTSADLAQK